jgi:hypothetical protein
MNHEDENLSAREKGMIRMRSIMDLGMGILWFGMGIFMLFVKSISPSMALRYDDPVMKGFGFLCIAYGSFRVYRGIKKNYRKS